MSFIKHTNSKSLILGFWSLLSSFSVFSQNSVIDFEYNTGFISSPSAPFASQAGIIDYNDSLILFQALKSYDGSDSINILNYYLRKSDLSTQKVDTFWTNNNGLSFYQHPNGNFQHPGIFNVEDLKNNKQYYVENYTDTNQTLHYNLSTADSLGHKDSAVFSINMQNRIHAGGFVIYDNDVYISTLSLSGDTLILYYYDINGSLVDSGMFSRNLSNGFVGYPLYSTAPSIEPQLNDSNLVFIRNYGDVSVQLINRYTLDTAGVIELSYQDESHLLNNSWGVWHGYAYFFDSTSVRAYGTLRRSVGIPFSQPKTFNIFRIELGYDNTLKSYNDWGDSYTDERIYGAVFESDSFNVFAGASPFSCSALQCAEYRQLLIYRETANSVDSLFLYGHSNHVPFQLFQDANQDIFIASQYTNAWSDDSLYAVVTKVPSSLLTSIKEIESPTTSIVVYPNPTTNFISSEEFKQGSEYQIYDVNGSLVRQGRLLNSEQVDVSSLTNGTYFIKVHKNNKQNSTRATMFIKQ